MSAMQKESFMKKRVGINLNRYNKKYGYVFTTQPLLIDYCKLCDNAVGIYISKCYKVLLHLCSNGNCRYSKKEVINF